MSDQYQDFLRQLDEDEQAGGEPSHGIVSEPVPKGKYWMRVERINGRDESKNGVPRARLQLRILDLATAQPTKLVAFVDFYLGASRVKRVGSEDVPRNEEEYRKAVANASNKARGFRSHLGVPPGVPVGEGADVVFNAVNVDAWVERDFVGELSVDDGGRNMLRSFYATTDPKNGLEALRAKGGK